MAGPHLCSVAPLLLLLATVGLAAAMPPDGVEEHRLSEPVDVPQETFDKGFPANFAHNLPTHEFMGDFANSEAAREDSKGFVAGNNNFPGFASIGGFGPMSDVDETADVASFSQPINFPSADFGSIDDFQSSFPQTPSFPQQTRDFELKTDAQIRRRRATSREGEVDTDSSLSPHKRVHRVQAESLPDTHSRQPRDFDLESSSAEVPHYFSSVSQFDFPRLQPRRRQSSAFARSAQVTGSRLPGIPYPADLRRKDTDDPRGPDEDLLQPEGQRFFPSFNGHHPPAQFTPSRAPFFPSPPIPPHIPPTRGGRFLPRGVGYRDSPGTSPRDQFRDVHHQGPSVREPARIKPDTSFSSASRRPFHREHEHFGHDNSILGSGNFEVLSGGTFYDLDDTNGHQHGYDHLLHNEDFVLFPSRRPHHPSPPRTNYVDDFFSNFRDFSEFAVRRSDEGETKQYDTDYYGRGYGSEHVHIYSNASNTTLPEKNATSDNSTKVNPTAIDSDPRKKQGSMDDAHAAASHSQQRPHRQPKNIQEVLEEVDPHPSDYASTSVAVEEKDPMIAMF